MGKPTGRGLLVGPKPVPYKVSNSPAVAGELAVTGVPSAWKITANACPFTFWGNNPGASGTTANGAVRSGWPATLTVRFACPNGKSDGSRKLICVGEAKNSGRMRFPEVTVTPASD